MVRLAARSVNGELANQRFSEKAIGQISKSAKKQIGEPAKY
jgi:hypothetical protein